jgi:hypothetical protein
MTIPTLYHSIRDQRVINTILIPSNNKEITMTTQRECVYQAVRSVCPDGNPILSKEDRARVRQIVFEEFRDGKVMLSKDWDLDKVWSYIPGLISNWLKKDKRFKS